MSKSNARKTNKPSNAAIVAQHAAEAEAPSIKVNAPASDSPAGSRKLEPIVLSSVQEKAYKELTTTSAKIRFLHAEKFSRGQIAAFIGRRYQHVRNVLITPLKKADNTNTKGEA